MTIKEILMMRKNESSTSLTLLEEDMGSGLSLNQIRTKRGLPPLPSFEYKGEIGASKIFVDHNLIPKKR